jgi:23S rRNA (pseudouridine1915-N3)-methyltransferase
VKLVVLMVGSASRGGARRGAPWADEAVRDYARRVQRWGGIDEQAVRSEPFRGDVEAVRAAEADRLLRHVGDRDRLIVLDERGLDPDLVRIVDEARQAGLRGLAFALGGAYGHHARVRDRAHQVVRLSALVLAHDVARVVLYEQLYRTMATLHGVPYAH